MLMDEHEQIRQKKMEELKRQQTMPSSSITITDADFEGTLKNGTIKGTRNDVVYMHGKGTYISGSWDFESEIRFLPGGDSFKEKFIIPKNKKDYGWNTTWIRY